MEGTIEKYLVNTFIRKGRQARLLYELTTPKKRFRGLDRFCHQTGELIDREKLYLEGEDIERRPEFARFLKSHNGSCVVLSPGAAFDGAAFTLSEAAALAGAWPDAAVIVGKGFALFRLMTNPTMPHTGL